MRVALCITGQFRTHSYCHENWCQFLIEQYKPDVFIHTWVQAGLGALRENVDEQLLLEMYDPVELAIEELPSHASTYLNGVRRPGILEQLEPVHSRGTLPMAYSMYRCHQMVERAEIKSGVKYDLVIKARPDLFFFRRPEVFAEIKQGRIYLEQCYLDVRYLMSDKFAFGDSGSMRYYMRLFEGLDRYWRRPILGNQWGQILSDERLMKHHLSISGIKVSTSKVLFYIKREAYTSKVIGYLEMLKATQRYYKNIIFTLLGLHR